MARARRHAKYYHNIPMPMFAPPPGADSRILELAAMYPSYYNAWIDLMIQAIDPHHPLAGGGPWLQQAISKRDFASVVALLRHRPATAEAILPLLAAIPSHEGDKGGPLWQHFVGTYTDTSGHARMKLLALAQRWSGDAWRRIVAEGFPLLRASSMPTWSRDQMKAWMDIAGLPDPRQDRHDRKVALQRARGRVPGPRGGDRDANRTAPSA